MNKLEVFKKRLFFIIGSLIVMITLLAVVINIQVFKNNERRKRESIERNLQIFEQMIEGSMSEIENLLISQNIEDVDLQKIRKPRKEIDRYLALLSKKEFFYDEIGKYKLLDGLFLYDKNKDSYIGTVQNTVSVKDHTAIKDNCSKIIAHFENKKDHASWFSMEADHTYYLFRVINLKGIYFGAWMKPDNTMETIRSSSGQEEGDDYYFLCEETGMILNRENLMDIDSISGKNVIMNQKKYNVYSRELEDGVVLSYAIADHSKKTFLEQMMPTFILILLFGSCALILSFVLTSEVIMNPLYSIFVEEERKKNQAQLQFLQIQVNPHFFNNCLSLIRNLILLDRNKEAEKVTLMLGRFTREYLNSETEIPLNRELERVKIYYELQKIRYEDKLELNVEVDQDMEDILVPAMSLQTFVENAIKHQRKQEGILTISLTIHFDEEKKLVKMKIADNGNGFDEEIMKQLNKGEAIKDNEGIEHIGIQNVTWRMKLLYGNASWIHFRNGENGGAKIIMYIPEKRMEQDENHE